MLNDLNQSNKERIDKNIVSSQGMCGSVIAAGNDMRNENKEETKQRKKRCFRAGHIPRTFKTQINPSKML